MNKTLLLYEAITANRKNFFWELDGFEGFRHQNDDQKTQIMIQI